MSFLRTPHYHVLLRHGYQVWTYTDWEAQKHTRHRIDACVEAGSKPVILTCRQTGCRIYGNTPDDMSEGAIHARIDTERHAS